jgi:hypothetical protein
LAFVIRLLFEVQVLRYLLALAPVVIAMLVWPHLALPISQAPIPMLFLIYFVETRVLNLSEKQRAALISEDEADRVRDMLAFNARSVLTRIAARRKIARGRLHLVVEQSELARMPVMSLVSIQTEDPDPEVLDLDARDREIIENGLFDGFVSEESLHSVTLRDGRNLHSTILEASEISAHARMAATLNESDTSPQRRAVS